MHFFNTVFSIRSFLPLTLAVHLVAHERVLIIHPQGTAQEPGRTVHGLYEQEVALAGARVLKECLQESGAYTVYITRDYAAQSSNRAIAQLSSALHATVIHIGCYAAERDEISFFYHDRFVSSQTARTFFIEPSCAGLLVQKQTCDLLKQLMGLCVHERSITCYGPFGMPLSALQAVIQPACLIDCGITSREQVQPLFSALAQALLAVKEGV